ncbi:hypothetical protein ACHQM5_009536 [Ranunculus cassubicifolius]
MEGYDEIEGLIQISITVLISLTFCHYVARKIPQGITRLVSILPVISIFTFLPLLVSSVHLVVTVTGVITWICSFKLVLFAFNQGPLSSPRAITLSHFIPIACLPIQIKQETPMQNNITRKGAKSNLNYAIKVLLSALLLQTYRYRPYIHPNMILTLYSIHLYLTIEIILAITALPARVLFGFEIESQFEDPYFSTSLQDFWSRRWNLMITSILRSTVYLPIRRISTPVIGRAWALVVSLVMTFFVSGLFHELLYFYTSHVTPTWEVTCFFVLHGLCTALEIMVKKKFGYKRRLHPIVSGSLTIVFVELTAFWLFFPQLIRNGIDVKIIGEYSSFAQFISRTFLSAVTKISSKGKFA